MAENQNENEVNNTEELENHVVEESFVREDLKQVAATSSIFDSLKMERNGSVRKKIKALEPKGCNAFL